MTFHPLVTFLVSSGSLLLALITFYKGILEFNQFFFFSIFLMLFFYTLLGSLRSKNRFQNQTLKWTHLKGILGRYIYWGLLLYILLLLYQAHSFYNTIFAGADAFLSELLRLYIILGIPYFILAAKVLPSSISDSFLVALASLKRKKLNHRSKTLLISYVLRAHFLAMMISQVLPTASELMSSLNIWNWTYSELVLFAAGFIWTMDSSNAAIGYLWESRLIPTRFKKMDPNPMSWLVTLSCYVPFNYWVIQLLPSPKHANLHDPFFHGVGGISVVLDIAVLIFLAGYIFSGTSLGFSTSNLTYKSIQTRGLYALVRHPATVCKVGFFSIAFARTLSVPSYFEVFAFLFWIMVYVLRALYEEKFLSKHEEYRTYMQKTRYRFIPGLF